MAAIAIGALVLVHGGRAGVGRTGEAWSTAQGLRPPNGLAQCVALLRPTQGVASARLAPRSRLLGDGSLGRALAALDRQQHLALAFHALAALLALRRRRAALGLDAATKR